MVWLAMIVEEANIQQRGASITANMINMQEGLAGAPAYPPPMML